MTKFQQQVLSLVKQIPRGKVTTYLIISLKLGNKLLVRAVGRALHSNPRLIEIPCHRVVKTDGNLGGYYLGIEKKAELLHNEGVEIKGEQIADIASCIYKFN